MVNGGCCRLVLLSQGPRASRDRWSATAGAIAGRSGSQLVPAMRSRVIRPVYERPIQTELWRSGAGMGDQTVTLRQDFTPRHGRNPSALARESSHLAGRVRRHTRAGERRVQGDACGRLSDTAITEFCSGRNAGVEGMLEPIGSCDSFDSMTGAFSGRRPRDRLSGMAATAEARGISALTEELRRLVAWPTPKVAASSPILCRLARPSRSVEPHAARGLDRDVFRIVSHTIEGIDEPVELLLGSGRSVSLAPDPVKRAYRLLFWLGRADHRASHEKRRAWAIEALGLPISVDNWRRDGAEHAFLRALAERMESSQTSDADVERFADESFDVSYRFDSQGLLVQQQIVARLRALVTQRPHSRLSMVTDAYPGHVFRVLHHAGATIQGMPVGEEGLPLALDAQGPPVEPGDVLTVTAVLAVDAKARINSISWTGFNLAEHVSIRVTFDPDCVPATMWRYLDAPSPEVGIAGRQSSARIDVVDASCYAAFQGAIRGRWLGLAWTWPVHSCMP